ncbi:glycosyltransferase [Pseudomonas sp. App30]|uniref:glycosyltransferase n=1 Tax=Pseudomonas sp. App30 TaxID=3068990 RepID=UPI003A80AB4B
MNLLFIHQNFPGQFLHAAVHFASLGHRVMALREGPMKHAPLAGVEVLSYRPKQGNTPGIHGFAQEFESKTLRAEGCALLAQNLAESGFVPDVILAHPGWGEALYLKDVFPEARLVCLMEYFYRAKGQDLDFDPEFPALDLTAKARLHTKNANLLLAMEAMDLGIAATHWQASTLPQWARAKTTVIHEGIDTDEVAPHSAAELRLPNKHLHVRHGDEVLTFVARNLEPVRGYHQFMRALPAIMKARPNLQVFIVGGEAQGYGSKGETLSWREHYLSEVAHLLDPARVHFLGQVSRTVFLRLMQISRCHVYLTYPFVLSWSMLEAMSAGAIVVGSDTKPVQEVIEHGKNGLLVDFFNPQQIASTVCHVLANPNEYGHIRAQARATIKARYDLKSVCLQAYEKILTQPHCEREQDRLISLPVREATITPLAFN